VCAGGYISGVRMDIYSLSVENVSSPAWTVTGLAAGRVASKADERETIQEDLGKAQGGRSLFCRSTNLRWGERTDERGTKSGRVWRARTCIQVTRIRAGSRIATRRGVEQQKVLTTFLDTLWAHQDEVRAVRQSGDQMKMGILTG